MVTGCFGHQLTASANETQYGLLVQYAGGRKGGEFAEAVPCHRIREPALLSAYCQQRKAGGDDGGLCDIGGPQFVGCAMDTQLGERDPEDVVGMGEYLRRDWVVADPGRHSWTLGALSREKTQ
jgi:hypothetical protein